jgi:O-antigen biosynthesis protein WbqV
MLVTAGHLVELQRLSDEGEVDEVRRALFELVAQIRGEKPGAAPALRVVANR